MDNFKYNIGSMVNNWTIISDVFRNKWNKKSVICKCTCGTIQQHELSKLFFTKECRKCYIKSKEKSKKEIIEYKRFWNTQKKYNINKEQFIELWNKQNGKCAICNKNMTMPENKRRQIMSCVSIDHNHKTNITRELLCSSCNKGIGHFDENIDILQQAINYLKKHEKISVNTSN